MSSLGLIVALLPLTGAANATLKPIDADFHPIGNTTVTVCETTSQGDLKIYLHRRIGAQPTGGLQSSGSLAAAVQPGSKECV
jgi:hypothetical protein